MNTRFRGHPRPHHHDDVHDGPRRGAGRGRERDELEGAGEFGFGHGPGRGGPFPRGGRMRSRRGDIRIALLGALSNGPGHGYELIQRLEERTAGRWRPSPGSVYPTLQLLEDGDFVTATQQDDKRVYAITEAGQIELARLIEQSGMPPWATDTEGAHAHGEMRREIGQIAMAIKQIGRSGTAEQVEAATGIITEARRKLYLLLAEA